MRRLLAPVMALGLVLAMAGIALAWQQPTLMSECAPDANHFAWKITLPSEEDYNIEWSFDSGFAGATTIDFGSAGDHEFTTDRGGTTLYVRWASDKQVWAQADADESLCEQPSVEESVAESTAESTAASTTESIAEQTVEAGTGTPTATVPNTSLDSTGSGPLPTILFSLVLLGSLGTLAYGNVKLARAPRRTR